MTQQQTTIFTETDELKLLTAEELSVKFGLSPKTIRNWIALRKIPFIFVGRRAMFLPSSIHRWLKSKEIKSQQ